MESENNYAKYKFKVNQSNQQKTDLENAIADQIVNKEQRTNNQNDANKLRLSEKNDIKQFKQQEIARKVQEQKQRDQVRRNKIEELTNSKAKRYDDQKLLETKVKDHGHYVTHEIQRKKNEIQAEINRLKL